MDVVKDLKDVVRDDAYLIDPHVVAVAVLRRVAERHLGQPAISRRCARARAGSRRHPRRWR